MVEIMAWEYLENEDFDVRYSEAAKTIGTIKNLQRVLDFNSGNSRFGNHLKGDFIYLSNDLYDGRALFKLTDWEFFEMFKHKDNVHCISCFGIGGYEITQATVESPTITDTLIKATLHHRPKFLVIEAIVKYSSILEKITREVITQTGGVYELLDAVYINVPVKGPEPLAYCYQRKLMILRRKE